MSGWQQVIIVGNLGRDPESRALPDGTEVCNFSVAVTEKWTAAGEKQEKTTWFNCSAFGKAAKVPQTYLRKGSTVMLVGTVSARAYAGNDGTPGASLDMRVQRVQLLPSGGTGADAAGDIPDEDIPF